MYADYYGGGGHSSQQPAYGQHPYQYGGGGYGNYLSGGNFAGSGGQSGGMYGPGYEGPTNTDAVYIGLPRDKPWHQPPRPVSPMYPNQMRIPGQYQPQPQQYNRRQYMMPHGQPAGGRNWQVGMPPQPGYQRPWIPPTVGGGQYQQRKKKAGQLGGVMPFDPSYRPAGLYHNKGVYQGYNMGPDSMGTNYAAQYRPRTTAYGYR